MSEPTEKMAFPKVNADDHGEEVRWHCKEMNKSLFDSRKEFNEALWHLAVDLWGASDAMKDSTRFGLDGKWESAHLSLNGLCKVNRTCAFKYQCKPKCPWYVRGYWQTKTGKYFIVLPSNNHDQGRHVDNVGIKRGVAKVILMKACPSREVVTDQMPMQATGRATKAGAKLTDSAQKKCGRAAAIIKKKLTEAHLPEGVDSNTWEAVRLTVDLYLEGNRETPDINDDHQAFVLEGGFFDPADEETKNFIYDPQDERFAVVVSTNNLLLNAYRQVQAGPDIFICLDTSYRYNTAGWGLMPIGTMDRTATGHTIAYALVSKEDHKVHEFVLSAVKKHVERVVNESCT
jgi:hypothetical protein